MGKTENQKEEVDELEKSCWLFISCFFIFSPSPFRQTTTPPSLSLSLPHLSPWFAAMSWQRHNWESKLRHFQLIAFKILTFFFFFIRKKLPRLLLCKETAANGEHFWIKIEFFEMKLWGCRSRWILLTLWHYIFVFLKNGPTPASFSFIFVFSNTLQILQQKMSIKYMIQWFKLTTFGTWVSSQNH